MLVRTLPLAVISLMALWGCAGPSTDDRLSTAPERNRGNATVRAAVYTEAAGNITAPAPVSIAASGSAGKTAAGRGKQDKRAAPSSRKEAPVAAVPPARKVASVSDTAGRIIDQRVPLSATGYRYTYAVELDAGGTKTFGFATDQGLLVGDRVLVNEAGVTLLRN